MGRGYKMGVETDASGLRIPEKSRSRSSYKMNTDRLKILLGCFIFSF